MVQNLRKPAMARRRTHLRLADALSLHGEDGGSDDGRADWVHCIPKKCPIRYRTRNRRSRMQNASNRSHEVLTMPDGPRTSQDAPRATNRG